MSITIQGISKTKILTALDTYVHTCLNTSLYTVSVQLSEIPPSGITIAIKQNSSTIVSTAAPGSQQSHVELQCIINAAVNDTISVVLASSTAADSNKNAFKAILAISQGVP